MQAEGNSSGTLDARYGNHETALMLPIGSVEWIWDLVRSDL